LQGEEEEEEEEEEASLHQQATLNGAGVDEEDAGEELGSEGMRGEELLKLVAGVSTGVVTCSFLTLPPLHTHTYTHTHTHTLTHHRTRTTTAGSSSQGIRRFNGSTP